MSEYDYLNSRIKGLGSRLLGRDFFDQVLAVEGVNLLVDSLLNSDYEKDLREALTVSRGLEAVESALRRNLFSTFQLIRMIAPEGPRRLIDIQLSRWDMANIRAIIRGKAKHVENEELLKAVCPVGQFSEAQLIELISENDPIAVADALITWNYQFTHAIRGAIRDKLDPYDPVGFETVLDKAYFGWARAQLGSDDPDSVTTLGLVRTQIDLANVMTALRTMTKSKDDKPAGGMEPIPGGKIGLRILDDILKSSSLDDAFEILGSTYFAPAIERGILAFGETGRLGVMERFFEIFVIELGAKLYRKDPLGIAVPLGYVWRKFNEFVNLRILLRGKAYEIPANTIREELLFV